MECVCGPVEHGVTLKQDLSSRLMRSRYESIALLVDHGIVLTLANSNIPEAHGLQLFPSSYKT